MVSWLSMQAGTPSEGWHQLLWYLGVLRVIPGTNQETSQLNLRQQLNVDGQETYFKVSHGFK